MDGFTVVFDLDGTLADTSADLIAAANACFVDLGHGTVLDPAADAATAFRGGRAMLRLGFARLGNGGPTDIEREFPRFLDHYADNIHVHTRLYPGARDAVEAVMAAGARVAICTNKPEALAVDLVDRLGMAGHFGALVGADTLPVRKPDPTPYHEAVARAGGATGRSVLIGDTITDRDTARSAGVPCVLVTFGPDGDRVSELEPDALLRHFDHLGAVLAPLVRH
ncbi:MAG: HAD-IA family hydrolase [Pseudomonadota bacterium]